MLPMVGGDIRRINLHVEPAAVMVKINAAEKSSISVSTRIHMGTVECVACGSPPALVEQLDLASSFMAWHHAGGVNGRFVQRRIGLQAQQIRRELFRFRRRHDFEPAGGAKPAEIATRRAKASSPSFLDFKQKAERRHGGVFRDGLRRVKVDQLPVQIRKTRADVGKSGPARRLPS